MKSCTAYQGCPVCLHTWSPGAPLGQTKCVCDGYRRFLAPGSRGRRSQFRHNGHRYEYGSVERRSPPDYRDNKSVSRAVRFASRINGPFLGHKISPLPNKWPAYCFQRYIPGELMHDSKILTEMAMKCLVGKGPTGTSYTNWNKDAKHRRQAQTRGIFRDIWPGNDGPLPWRLTAAQRRILDERMKNIVWPHYMERLCYDGKIYIYYQMYIINHVYIFICLSSCFFLQVPRCGQSPTECGKPVVSTGFCTKFWLRS